MAEIFLDAADGGEFTLSASHGLKGDLVHAGTDLEHVLHLVEDGKQTLQLVFGLVGVNVGNTGSWAITSLTLGLCFMVHEPRG